MRPLYEIHRDFEQIQEYCDRWAFENGGELPADLEGQLEAISLERLDKIRSLGLWIKNMSAYEDMITEEIRKLEARRKPLRSLKERIKDKLLLTLNEEEKYKDGSLSIGWSSSTRCIVDDPQSVPDQYVIVERKVLTEEIKRDLKIGVELPFARLEKRRNLQIK